MGREGRGRRALSEPALTVLASPILGAPLSRELLERIESVDGVRCVRIGLDGRLQADSDDDAAYEAAEVLLLGAIPASALDHVVARAPRLRWIHSASAGVDRVTTPAVRERRLTVTNARGVFSRPIAEYVVMMSLAIARRLPALLELQRERTWQPLRGRELSETTVGIVGYGSIGEEVARLLQPFGCRLLAARRHPDRSGEPTNVEVMGLDRLSDLLRQSDIVVVAAPLTDDTAGLIGAEQLGEMRQDAWLVNIARGRLVDELALRRALQSGSIGGAVLDVFSEEPLPPESPLYSTPNVIITPHTSWTSERVAERTVELFVENLRRDRAGEPLRNVVDLDAGY